MSLRKIELILHGKCPFFMVKNIQKKLIRKSGKISQIYTLKKGKNNKITERKKPSNEAVVLAELNKEKMKQ